MGKLRKVVGIKKKKKTVFYLRKTKKPHVAHFRPATGGTARTKSGRADASDCGGGKNKKGGGRAFQGGNDAITSERSETNSL